MTTITDRLAGLSPEKRALLELRMRRAQAEAAGPALRPRPRAGGPLPCSYAQQRLWLLDRLDPGKPFYNTAFHVRLRGALDADALSRAVESLRERHEVLRTTLEERGGEPVQVIHAHVPSPLPVVDLQHVPAEARDAEVERRSWDDAHAPFDLARGPLLRATLLKLAEDDHALLLTLHHAASDGWSMGVIARELGSLYAAFAEGRPSPLAPLPVQYADYALWQRERLTGDGLERQLAFWRKTLEGAPASLDLNTDHVRPPVASHQGARAALRVDPALAGRLRALARAEEATLFPVLLAGFRAVLSRHAGQRDVVLGTPAAGRTRAELESLVGFFVNTLALRAPIEGDPDFRALLRRERDAALAALAHQEVPFERVVDEVKAPRDAGRNPLFQAMLSLQSVPAAGLELPGVEARQIAVRWCFAKFDLTADIYEETDGALRIEMEYAADLFDESSARRVGEHLVRFLDEAAADPDRPLSEIGMMGPEERRAVLTEWNDTAREYPRDATIPALFAQVAAAHSGSVAVVFGEERLTYAELDARANRLARLLRRHGAGPGSRVGIALDRSAEMVVAVLAALKAGAAYVPLDPSYPAERLAFMMADSGVGVLVVRDELPAPLAAFGGTVVSFAGDREALAAESAEGFDCGATALSPAYVIYTSGSTGTPKGVEVPHRGVVRLVRGTEYADLGPEQSFLHVVPLAFDASTFDLWAPLLNGGRLVVFPPERPSPEAVARVIREEEVTTILLPTGLFQQLAAWGVAGLPLQQVVTGGDAMPLDASRRVLEALPGVRLVNVYGPTENSNFTTHFYVLDERLRPCPIGVPGELCAAGDGVAIGYVNRPELTAARFVTLDVGDGPERVYRTGDLARRLEDGRIEFLGRLDAQVKVRGFRVEPAEVEAVLAAHPSVAGAAVVAAPDPGGGKRLVAYVAPVAGTQPTAAGMRDALRRRLPEFMVPAVLVFLDQLPLTANGKVDRGALPPPPSEVPEGGAEPATETERALADIWREVLEVKSPGRGDDFFALGGHSLAAMRVVTHVRDRLAVELPLARVFERPTLEGMAAAVDALHAQELAALLDEVEGLSEDDLQALADASLSPQE
jgi:non-ribosomal peptide synthetase component F/acyl carrier protein